MPVEAVKPACRHHPREHVRGSVGPDPDAGHTDPDPQGDSQEMRIRRQRSMKRMCRFITSILIATAPALLTGCPNLKPIAQSAPAATPPQIDTARGIHCWR